MFKQTEGSTATQAYVEHGSVPVLGCIWDPQPQEFFVWVVLERGNGVSLPRSCAVPLRFRRKTADLHVRANVLLVAGRPLPSCGSQGGLWDPVAQDLEEGVHPCF